MSRSPVLLAATHRALARPCEIQVLRRIVPPGATVVDVGANVGQFAQPLANMVGPSGRVYAFEPIAETYARLALNLRRFRPSGRVILEPLALSSHQGEAQMYVPDRHGLEASLAQHSEFSSWNNPEVNGLSPRTAQVTTLDEFSERERMQKADLLKIDVEGAELLVLQGGPKFLETFCPVLLIEVYSLLTRDFGYRPMDLFAFLHDSYGYNFYHFLVAELKPVDHSSEQEPGWFPRFINFLGLHPERHSRQIAALQSAGLLPTPPPDPGLTRPALHPR